MSKAESDGLIGVDGGGTNCRISLLHDGRRTDIKIGSANVYTNLDAAIETIRQGLEQAAEKAGITMSGLRSYPAYIGLAGLMGSTMARRVLEGLPLDNAMVEDDRKSAVVGAHGACDGSVAGIGTGSFLARQSQGIIQFIGGYGFQLGDEASGATLGRSLLSRILLIKDGLETASVLTETVFAEFNSDVNHVVEFGKTAIPQSYARYAPRVVEAAKAGDIAGQTIMRAGADYIERGIRKLGWHTGEALCLIGGLAPHYQPYLSPELAQAVTAPKNSALDATLALAARINSNTDKTKI